MVIGARKFVEPTAVTPLPYGLMSVVNLVPDADPHARMGVMFQPHACDAAHSTQESCPLDDIEDFRKTPTSDGIPARAANPVTLYTWIDCSPVGAWNEFQERTETALDLGAPRALENVFWTGEVDQPATGIHYPHLAANASVFDPAQPDVLLQSPAVIPVAGPHSVFNALGILEGAMGTCYPGVPTIHVPREAVAVMDRYNLLERRGDVLYTLSGSKVAAGAGYPGTSPAGVDPAYPGTWFYATGQITMRVSDTQFTSSREAALRRDINSMVLIAERTYSLSPDCCHFAVEVDLALVI